MLLQGGSGGGTPEERTREFIDAVVIPALLAGEAYPKGGDARFAGKDLSVGGNLSLIGGDAENDPVFSPGYYISSGFAGDASLSVTRLSVGGDVVLAGGEDHRESGINNGGGSYGGAFLAVADSLSVQGDMRLAASSGVGGGVGTGALATVLEDSARYESYTLGATIGGMAHATARTISVGGDLTLTGGSNSDGMVAEERAGEYINSIIGRLQSPAPYLELEYGGFGDLSQTERFGLLLFSGPVSLLNAETLAVSGSISLQAGSGNFPITSSRGRYTTGIVGGSALMAVGSMTVGQDLSVLARGSGAVGDARLLVGGDLSVGGTMTLKSGSALGLNGYGATDSTDYYRQMLSQLAGYEAYELGDGGTGGVAFASARNVMIRGDLNIEGDQGYGLSVAEERWSELQTWLLANGVYNSGARAELQAQDIRVSGSVTLRGGQGKTGETTERGRYASGTDGGLALISGSSLLAGGDVSLSGGNWEERGNSGSGPGVFSSRGGQAMIALDGAFTSLGSVSVRGGDGANWLRAVPENVSNLAAWMERAGEASISAQNMTIGGDLTLGGGLGQSGFLSSALLAGYQPVHSAGQALVEATNVTLAGNLDIRGGDGGAEDGAYSGGRGGLAALDLEHRPVRRCDERGRLGWGGALVRTGHHLCGNRPSIFFRDPGSRDIAVCAGADAG